MSKCVRGHLEDDSEKNIGDCQQCMGVGCTEPNEAAGEFRSIAEYHAGVGESLLRKSANWKPENDCEEMTVPEMLLHIYKNRKSDAVAPNGHTCPFLTLEEWKRIEKLARRLKTADDLTRK
jgi:hypothetical protein